MTGILGVDPGLSGAIALLGDDGELLNVADMPTTGSEVDPYLLANLIDDWDREWPIDKAWVEKVGSMPGQGVASTFKFGDSYGVVRGALGHAGISTAYVRPGVWKRAAGLSKDKGASRRLAIATWPGWSRHFARVKDDGRAEAALVARHGWLELTRSTP